MYVALRRCLACSSVVPRHLVDGRLVALPELRPQLLILLAIAPRIQRELPRVVVVREEVQDDTHGPYVDRVIVFLDLELGCEVQAQACIEVGSIHVGFFAGFLPPVFGIIA